MPEQSKKNINAGGFCRMDDEASHTPKKESPQAAYNSFEDSCDSCFSKSICSSTDCTGLIPVLPSSEAELEAYEEMYQFCLKNAVNPSEDK